MTRRILSTATRAAAYIEYVLTEALTEATLTKAEAKQYRRSTGDRIGTSVASMPDRAATPGTLPMLNRFEQRSVAFERAYAQQGPVAGCRKVWSPNFLGDHGVMQAAKRAAPRERLPSFENL